MRNPKVTHFCMNESMKNTAIDHRAPSDAGPDRHIDEVWQSAGGTPSGLPQCGRVHICFEPDRHIERLSDIACQVVVLPSGFWRRRDVAEVRRRRIKVDWTKRPNTNRLKPASPTLLEECCDFPHCRVRRCSRKLSDLQIVRSGPNPADKLSSARLDAAEHVPGYT